MSGFKNVAKVGQKRMTEKIIEIVHQVNDKLQE